MSISMTMHNHLGVDDFRMEQEHDTQTVYYDSAASNIASNTDMDSNDEDDEDDDDDHNDIDCTPSPSPRDFTQRDFTPTPAPNLNMGYNSNDRSGVTISRYHTIENEDEIEIEMEKPSTFKIIVSAPNNEEIINTNNGSIGTMMNDRQNELMSRLKPKRTRRRYLPQTIESGASDDCSSCDDDDVTSIATGNEMEDDLYSKSSLFLSENNLQRGVYASFGFSDTETDYLSPQSDDFDELTICYHHRNDRDQTNPNNDNNLNVSDGKNIRFRNHLHSLNDPNYLSDIGPSDIGSSDTECFSSNDSIPDSIPPPINNDDDEDFVSIN